MQEKIGYPDSILNNTFLMHENKGVRRINIYNSVNLLHLIQCDRCYLLQVTVFKDQFFETVLNTLSSNARDVLQRLRRPFDRTE